MPVLTIRLVAFIASLSLIGWACAPQEPGGSGAQSGNDVVQGTTQGSGTQAPSSAPTSANPTSTTPTSPSSPAATNPEAGRQTCLAPLKAADGTTNFPRTLSQTGCFLSLASKQPAASLLPYNVRIPLWSDGASKRRWLALPDGTRLAANPNGDVSLPPGGVLLKEFSLGGQVLETRMLARRLDGQYALATYRWNSSGTDAEVVLGDWQSQTVGGIPWTYFGPAGCVMCHSGGKGNDLGLSIAQLDVPALDVSAAGKNQVSLWKEQGILENVPAATATGFDTTTVAGKARAYLDVNCSSCHSVGARYYMGFDFAAKVPISQTGFCNTLPAHGNFGITDAKLLAPGRPDLSVLLMRMRAIDSRRMPKFGSEVVDTEGTAVVQAWISQLKSCENDP